MKSKNIRKENSKKRIQQPIDHNFQVYYTDINNHIDYYISHNNCEAVVRLQNTLELVGVYKAATRNWKKVHYKDYLTTDIKRKVESLYA